MISRVFVLVYGLHTVVNQEVFGSFGTIINLAISSDKSNAIVAFASQESAMAAGTADIPKMHIRQRQRKKEDSQSITSEREVSHSTDPRAEIASESSDDLSLGPLIPIDEAKTNLLQADSTQEVFLVTLERPPSLVLVQQSRQNSHKGAEMLLEDVLSMPNSPTSAHSNPELMGSALSDDDIVAISHRIEHQEEDLRINDTGHDAAKEEPSAVEPTNLNEADSAVSAVQTEKDRRQEAQIEIMPMVANALESQSHLVSPDEAPNDKNSLTPALQPVKIIVRSRGSINSATTQEKMIPQTLLSTEADSSGTDKAEEKAAPLVRKSSFINDIRHILSRKRSRNNIQEETAVAQPPEHQEMRRSRSLAALVSASRKETNAQEPAFMTPTNALSQRMAVYCESACQTTSMASQCADKACETDCIGEFITVDRMENDPTVFQLIRRDLEGMEKVRRALVRLNERLIFT